jgi:hypothetical protein
LLDVNNASIQVREKYFLNLSFEVGLLLLCLKEYGKARRLIDFWGIEGEMNDAYLGEAINLMQSKDI